MSDMSILKIDEEQRIVYGWASVSTFNGEYIVDNQGDVITMGVLSKAVNDFMENVRIGKVMHSGEQTGSILHSFLITKDISEALGFSTDKEGWIVGYKVYDDEVWKQVKDGTFAAFSIGGAGQKEELDL
jgi:hypothetical protein